MTMEVDGARRHLSAVGAIIRKRVPGACVRVFGSRVRGTAWEGSDLDVLIEGGGPVPESVLAELDLDFADSDLPFRVDLRDGATLDPAFRQRIGNDLRDLDALPGGSSDG